MQKKTLLLSLILLGYTPFAFSSAPQINCSYSGKFEECYNANISGTPRSITEFVCLDRSGNWEQVLSQIILDEEFQEFDTEIEEYLKKLEESKGEYFGADKKDTFLRGVDDVYKQFTEYGYYGKRYMELCEKGIIEEIIKCGDEIEVSEAQQFLGGTKSSSCQTLALAKLDIYRQVAINVLKINKVEVRKDERKEFVKKERSKYDELLDDTRVVIGDMERMKNGWATKTRDVAVQIIKTVIQMLS